MAAHRVHRGADLLSHLAPARQPAVVGIVVHDHWKPYYTREGVLHALCNAHHLRELQVEKEEWARRMQRLLRRACHATHLARDRGVPLEPRLIDQFRRRYDIIVTEGLAFHQDQPPLATPATNGGRKRRGPRRTGHNLLLRLSTRKSCASWTIPPCPSPTIRPSAMGA